MPTPASCRGEVPAEAQVLGEAIAGHAERDPDAVALVDDEGVLDYATVVSRAEQVACLLARHGVAAGDTVALHGGVSRWTVVAALGVLRSGAVVVPIGEHDPAARVSVVLHDAGTRLALSTASDTVPWRHEVPVVLDPRVSVSGPAPVAPSPADLAYILFTSGSSGRPKGVMIEHRNLMHYVRGAAHRYRVDGAVPVLPALTPLSFDASVLQVYAPLARGETVWLLPGAVREDPAELVARLAARPGSGLHCVPSLWEEVLREMESSGVDPRLSALLLGGEVVPADLWARTRRILPDLRLANVYGPTETTVQATGSWHDPDEPGSSLPPHVGLPLPGVGVTVRTPRGEQVAVGERGEVWITGGGVGRGYLDRPDLTAESFVDTPGGRAFRTGDEGFIDQAGRLTVLGRLDDQVKVRGYRVELGEIEAALRTAPGVREAAAAVLQAGTSAARVVALVVGDVVEAAARDHCAARLPDYMVPGRVRVVPALPRTANGKVDRAGVRAAFPSSGTVATASGGSETERLRALWRGLLGVAEVADDDDFFTLGGHSLLATRLIGRARKELGRPVPLRTIFVHRTFADFATAVRVDSFAPAAPGPEPVPEDVAVPLSLEQQALWELYQAAPELPSANVLLPLAVTGPVDERIVSAALERLQRDHLTLRSVVEGDAAPRVRVLPAAQTPLQVVDLRTVADADRRVRAQARALYLRPFRLDAEPPIRAAWLRLADNRSVLVLCLHHIACDGVSLQLIATDLARSLSGGQTAPPRLQHRDYAAWQRRRWDAGELRPSFDYWSAHLATAGVALNWGRPPAVERTFRARTVDLRSRRDLGAMVGAIGATYSATAFTVLAAALAVSLSSVTGTTEPVLGMLAANRPHADLERTVGMFAATLAVRVRLDDPAPGALLRRVGDAVVTAQSHQEVPLGIVAAQAVARQPPFQVGLTVDLAPPAALPPGPVSVDIITADATDVPTGVGAASCPLTVFARQHEGRLQLTAEYETDVLDEKTALRVLDGLAQVLVDWS